ncbi:MAG: hypothetical protein B7Z26_07395, partial [Asticcacaulis sp. 32-58-5]
AAKLVLTADRTALKGDGRDVAILKVEAFDAKGRPVPKADHLVTFEVSGPGAVIGVGNGNPVSHEADKASERKLFNGLAQAIVQTDRKAGGITVTARAEGLRASSVKLTAS